MTFRIMSFQRVGNPRIVVPYISAVHVIIFLGADYNEANSMEVIILIGIGGLILSI